MTLAANEIAVVAQAIMDRLSHRGTDWTVIQVVPEEEAGFATHVDLLPKGVDVPQSIWVLAAKVAEPECTVSAFFSQTLPTQQAIARLASSLQDEVIETVWAAVPACVDHSHPLSAQVVDGRAVWVCPLGTRPKEPISEVGFE